MSVVSLPGRMYGEFHTNINIETGETEDDKTAVINFSIGEYDYFKRCINFYDCVAFGKTAKVVFRFYEKNRSCVVEGSLGIDKYSAKDGREVRKVVIIAKNVTFLTDGVSQVEKGADREAPQQEKSPSQMSDSDSPEEGDKLPF